MSLFRSMINSLGGPIFGNILINPPGTMSDLPALVIQDNG